MNNKLNIYSHQFDMQWFVNLLKSTKYLEISPYNIFSLFIIIALSPFHGT